MSRPHRLLLIAAFLPALLTAQQDSARVLPPRAPKSDSGLVQDGVYNRPFITSVARTSIGGYVEGNTNYSNTDGVSEGFSAQLRRFNIFLFSSLGPRLRLISELEFEDGTKEISLETALIDFEINPAFVVRAGILLPPIGAFNVNHDSPRWDFIERPIVSTEIIPATLSEVGFGAHGRVYPAGVTLTYDVYLTNGLTDGVVLNDRGRTSLAAGKSPSRFEEDNNGSPTLSGRVAVSRRRVGEFGVSYYGGVYNRFAVDGIRVDRKRRLSLMALDGNTRVGRVELRGELAVATIDVPADLAEVFGRRQSGWHIDAVVPVLRPRISGLPKAVVSVDLRLEGADFNRGRFASTGASIGDETRAVVAGVSFRPVAGTVFKANYRRQRTYDLPRNAPARLGAIQVGFATYF
jgi:hypothetical protein